MSGGLVSNKIKKHPSLCYVEDIADICRPITQLDISYFAHVHIDNTSQFSALSNHPQFTEHYLKNHYYNADIHLVENKQVFNYVIWDALEFAKASKALNNEAVEFGIRHGFTIMKQGTQGCDFYHFATHHLSPSINEVYMSQFDLLHLFITYFTRQIKSSKKLHSAYDLKFKLDPTSSGFTTESVYDGYAIETMREKFLLQIDRNSYLANNQHTIICKSTKEMVSLSPQLHRCFSLLLTGLSAKQIANKLNLSQRTVENYILKIRNLIGCRNSKELLASYSLT